jgi:ribosomal protein S18 acetylase RimI-like enzyme
MAVTATLPAGVTLRARLHADLEFLLGLYAASRWDEAALPTEWTDTQKDAFLRFQFHVQDTHYRTRYPRARYDVIVRDGEDIGRLYVEHTSYRVHIVDITLLPDHRNQGIGRALVQVVLDEAARDGKIVSLHVGLHNPARALYHRMGFRVAGNAGVYQLMHWIPPALTAVDARPKIAS